MNILFYIAACIAIITTLRMVTGTGCDDTARGLLGRQRRYAIECAALLERARHLQVFEFEINLLTGQRREHLRVWTRRVVDRSTQPLSCGLHVGEADA